MGQQRRHAPVSRRRNSTLAGAASPRAAARGPLARLQRGSEGVFAEDHGDRRRGGRFRWFLSTCFAAGIGAFAILFALLGANGEGDGLQLAGQIPSVIAAAKSEAQGDIQGLAWALPKGDKLVMTSGAMSTRFTIHDSIRQLRDNRSYLQKKTYARIVAHLASAPPPTDADKIPPFNPYTLFANSGPGAGTDTLADVEQQEAKTNTVELLGGILPNDDGQELNLPEVTEVVARDAAQDEAVALKPGFQPAGAEKLTGPQLLAQRVQRVPDALPPNTTALAKSVFDTDDADDDLEAREVRVIKVARGDTLPRILERLNTEAWQIGEIVQAAKGILADGALSAGQEVQVILVPSLTKAGANDVSRLSVYADGREHKLTVVRKPDGDFGGSATPLEDRGARMAAGAGSKSASASVYSSLFLSSNAQGLPLDTITQILKIHASETDFRRRVGASDAIELFFDVKEEDKGNDGSLGELLATALTVGGETQKYYRFRQSDGSIDFYDENGNNSRKFLMRKPVRGEARLADGFGWRRHPILGVLRRHAGIDWAGVSGTPVMAAGMGVVEEVGRKGEYGNYVRIRHANGYSTAYAHLSRFGAGIANGARVTQGQVIGYIGTTGLSTGAHLHFEVLVNNQQIDPIKMPVPKERKLAGKDLLEFQKERVRIDGLMRRNPVSTKVVEAQVPK